MQLLDRISRSYRSLSKQHRRIGDYLLENYREAAFMSLRELSEAAGVSASTIVRFAYALGCSGWPELHKELKDSLPAKLTAVERLNMLDGMTSDSVVESSFRTDIENLRATAEQNSAVLIDAVVCALDAARRIYLVGSRSSGPLIAFLEYYLRYMADNVRALQLDGADLYAQTLGIESNDCVLAVSFPRYATTTLRVLESVRSTQATSIVITDRITAPPALLSDYTLTARSFMNSFVDSFVAPLALINALIVKLGLRRRAALCRNFARLEELWRLNNVYASREFAANEDI